MSRRSVIVVLFAVAVGAGAFYLATARRPTPAAPDLPPLGAVPPFTLTSQDGKPVTLADLQGKVWIADFIFTRCAGQCPLMTSRMGELTIALENEPTVRFVSFSVDPEHDTPDVLRAYAQENHADLNRWTFLTGPKAEIRSLAIKGFKLAVEDANPKDPEPILHSTRFVLVDGNGSIRGTYDSGDVDRLAALRRDARRLAAEPGKGRA